MGLSRASRSVYLPAGYEDSDRRYPRAYLLQAFGTTAAEMVTPPTDGRCVSSGSDRRLGVAGTPGHRPDLLHHAELVRNRTFRSDWTGVLNWFVVERGSSSARIPATI